MRLFTFAEVIEDFSKSSGEKLCLAKVIRETLEEVRFIKLYSHTELPSPKMVTGNRFMHYVLSRNVLIPKCDVWPDKQYPYCIYRIDLKTGEGSISDQSLIFLGGIQNATELPALITAQRVADPYRKIIPIFTVDTHRRETMTYPLARR